MSNMHYEVPTGLAHVYHLHSIGGSGRVVRWCWVNFQCPGRPIIWMIVGQGLIALAVGASGAFLDIFTLLYPFSPHTPSLWETARYRLKDCLKGPLSPKQPTNQHSIGDTGRINCQYLMPL